MSDYIRVCEEAVRAGGAVVQQWVGRCEGREKGPADLVTEADLAAQEAIRDIVLGAFPGHRFVGEEDISSDANRSSAFRWIADPLDGTTNYVHRVPHYSVSLALEHEAELLAGAVFNPVDGECFTAAKGAGAWLGGRPIRTSEVEDLSGALAVVGFPPKAPPESPDVQVFLAALQQCQAIRRTGSAALNLCYLAAGRFDVYWSFSTKVWDVAAGVLIVREAGGTVTGPRGGPFQLDTGQFLAAANDPLHTELREMVDEACVPEAG